MEGKVFKEEYKKRIIHFYILIWILIALLIMAGISMFIYFAKGESKMPFKISKILTISSAQTINSSILENNYVANVIQKNDIYISIQKNEKYNKEEIIKEITFDNFQILKKPNRGIIEIYKPSKTSKLFDYKEEYKVDSITYYGVETTDTETVKLQIANQGGILNLSIIINNLGEIICLNDENVSLNGKLLSKLEIPYEDIKFKISFEIQILVESGNTFYTTITMDLPTGNILKDGVVSREYPDIEKLIYKRK